MALAVGTRVGVYEITAAIGAGGMGKVYKARDTKLGREVAVKVLPEEFSEDKERLARFEREARLLASLNHPNIATLFDFQESDGVRFLVLEFVPGETLAERIAKGPIPTDEALPLFKQIAEALEAAHEQGVIHRDLKPANIKITPEGKIKVLDFGLAKAFGDESAASDSSQSPTMTRDATRAGVILGTASYMSPEQARGKSVDRRADIWAFACCLYETLTGQKAFAGETVTDILAAVVKNDPKWNQLPSTIPWRIRELIHRCLRKDMTRRLQHIGDARVDIEEALSEPSPISPATVVARSTWRAVLIASLLTALATALGIWILMRPSSPTRPIKRLAMSIPPTVELETGLGPSLGLSLAISPDGSIIAYLGRRNGSTQIYLRAMDQIEATPLRGTEGASQPFFSPDSQWIGFLADGMLKKVSLMGGPPVTLCDAGDMTLGASWAWDEIVFGSTNAGLSKVSAAGGEPQEVTELDSGEMAHRWPEILPNGKAVLFTSWLSSPDNARIVVQLRETGERRILIEGATSAHFASSGHIVFAREDSLLAMPFDPERLEVTGPVVPILEGILIADRGWASFGLSADGTLAYLSADIQMYGNKMVWVDRNGIEQALTDAAGSFSSPRLSPDNRRLAFSDGSDLWILELELGTMTRFTFARGADVRPIWFPDAPRLLFGSNRNEGTFNIFSKRTDESAAPEQLTTGAYRVPTSLSSDGKTVVFRQRSDNSSWDIGIMGLDGDQEITMLLETPFDEHTGKLSPDDRWLAYVSNESGRDEVYLQPFPGPGRKWRLSTDGGSELVWARSGEELFYKNGEKMVAVAVGNESDFTPGRPTRLFEGQYIRGGPLPRSNYDVSSDGQRFVMIKEMEESSTPKQITIVLNWTEELKRLAPSN